jgi:ankyrin repeat protein
LTVQKGHAEVVQMLLDAKTDVNLKNTEGSTALMFAAQNGHTELVQMLLGAKAEVNLQNQADITALMLAAFNGHAEVVEMLLGANADVNLKNTQTYGFTALMFAAQHGHIAVVQMLLDANADVTFKDTMSRTALELARERKHEVVVRLILKHQASGSVNSLLPAGSSSGQQVLQFLDSNAGLTNNAGATEEQPKRSPSNK